MAPFPVDIPDLGYSSLELDSRSSKPFDLAGYLSSLSLAEREALTSGPEFSHAFHKRSEDGTPVLSPSETFQLLTARNTNPTQTPNPASGSVDPNDINMKGIQAVFALIGVSMVLGAIWFFFWAKNGGFQFRKGDWDEYKSTVLRRKGPNGTTLSNATKSTKLGGGSVVGQGYSDDGSNSWEGTNTVTDMSSEAPIVKEKKSRKSQKESARAAKMRQANDAQWEGGHDNDVRAYRHERAARVGGLNKEADAQHYGTDYTQSNTSDMHSNSQRNSYQSPPQYSSRNNSPEKRQSRRDFSYGNDAGFMAAPPQQQQSNRPSRYRSPEKPARASRVPGSFAQADDFSDVQSQNTRSYHHPIPGLGQKQHGGYRRDRRDSLDD